MDCPPSSLYFKKITQKTVSGGFYFVQSFGEYDSNSSPKGLKQMTLQQCISVCAFYPVFDRYLLTKC